MCPQHGAVGAFLIFQNRAHPRERNKWSEATWFRESARTEHRSEGEAAAEGGADSLLLCEVAGAASKSFGEKLIKKIGDILVEMTDANW